ncbi:MULTISPECIES: hypothetical protein [unclassified Streptomyces]|uniref:hypothetical protein n=1 Tax=unclassified Streptomyces TaxID=2593676 RepID=UPI0033A301F3
MFQVLFGDAAGAVVVSGSEEAGAGDLVVEDVWELVLPDSSDAYWGVVHEDGVIFDSGPEATCVTGQRAELPLDPVQERGKLLGNRYGAGLDLVEVHRSPARSRQPAAPLNILHAPPRAIRSATQPPPASTSRTNSSYRAAASSTRGGLPQTSNR